jgi:two-component system response regulator PfeR
MKRILLMEDDLELAFQMRQWLTAAGYDVTWCRNADEGEAALQRHAFSLIVTDMYIRGSDTEQARNEGLSLIGTLRTGRFNKELRTAWNVPILAISGVVDRRGREFGLILAHSMGVQKTLSKPFSQIDFIAAVESTVTP